jgi:hypothetical protein
MTSTSTDTLRDSAADAADQVQRAAAPAINQVKRQAGVLVDQSGELIDKVIANTTQIAADLGKSAIAYIKKNPLTALLLALGAGALLVSAAKSVQSRR